MTTSSEQPRRRRLFRKRRRKPVAPLPPGVQPKKKEPMNPRVRLLIIIGIVVTVLAGGILALVLLLPDKEPEPVGTETVIHLAFAGDLTVTDKVIAAGKTESGYDYAPILQDVLPLLADADNTVLNFEGILCGEPYGSSSTSAPAELLDALKDAGVDMVQAANSCSINNGLLGLSDTLTAMRSAGLEPLGAYATEQAFQESRGFTMVEIQGIKVAFVAFTKGMDGLRLPEGQENLVNLLYTDYTSTYQKVDTEGITRIMHSIADEKPDFTVALLHWGSEHNDQISNSQNRIVRLLKQQGVDAIIGTHPHQVQSIDVDKETGTLVAYSLGDFWGDADRTASAYSAVLRLQVAKNDVTGVTRIAGFDYTPIYTYNQETEEGTVVTRLLRIPPALNDYEAHGLSGIPEDTYNTMKRAKAQVDKLFTPEEKKE